MCVCEDFLCFRLMSNLWQQLLYWDRAANGVVILEHWTGHYMPWEWSVGDVEQSRLRVDKAHRLMFSELSLSASHIVLCKTAHLFAARWQCIISLYWFLHLLQYPQLVLFIDGHLFTCLSLVLFSVNCGEARPVCIYNLCCSLLSVWTNKGLVTSLCTSVVPSSLNKTLKFLTLYNHPYKFQTFTLSAF